MTTACIMQPTYLPWAGYMAMLDRADVFVLLDTVEFSKQSWQQRNRIRLKDGSTVWLSVPVHQSKAMLLNEVRIDNSRPWRRKHWGTIQQAYSSAPYWDATVYWLHFTYEQEWENLTDLTYSLIVRLAVILGIDTPIVRASTLGSTRAGRIERLVDLCRLVDADVLLEPSGGTYLQDAHLPDIRVEWHDYQPAPYPQAGLEWQPYLSVIDAIAYHGTDTLSIIRQGYATQHAHIVSELWQTQATQ